MKMRKKLLTALEAEESGLLHEVLQEDKKEDVQALRALVTDGPDVAPELRRKAIFALGRVGDKVSVSRIRKLLPDLDEGETIAAVEALGRIGTPAAIRAVIDTSEHDSAHVRKFVVQALGRSPRPEARAKLAELSERDSQPYIRELAEKLVRPSD